jgi:phospholipase/lecithinase/hemolysin
MSLVLTSCGGGTQQIDPFTPARVIAFGDEMSAFAPDGRKYIVNSFDTAGTAIDCSRNPIWVQTVASLYGYRFKECLAGSVDPKAVTWAAPLARVADVKAQIDQQEALGFTAQDLAMVLVGTNDIKALYEARGTADNATLAAQSRQLGVDAAAQVNRMIALGAKVIVSTMPDLGLTPWGLAKGTSDAALLTNLSLAFNGGLRVAILQDGRYVGLVLADELMQTDVKFPSSFGLSNVTEAACLVALPDCTPSTLATGATATAWLWADELFPAYPLHQQLGSQAARLARSNPF